MSLFEVRNGFALMDNGRFVVVHPPSTLSLRRQMLPSQNNEFENTTDLFFAPEGRHEELDVVKFVI